MASTFKRTPKAARWTIAWRDENGKRRTRVAYADRRASVALANKLETEAGAIRDGLADPALERMAEHRHRPIADHVEDFRTHLNAKRNTAAHVDRSVSFIEWAIAECEWKSVSDIDAARLASRLAELGAREDRPLSPRARNARLRAVKSFTTWLVRERRLAVDPLAGLRPVRETDDRRIQRRALTPEETSALLAHVEQAGDVVILPKRYRYKGETRTGTQRVRIPNRAALYRLMLGTGFRVSEAASLRGRDFALNADPPVVRVRGAYAKNRRDVEQPIRRDLAETLRPVIDSTGPDDAVWPRLPSNMAPVVRADLDAARAAWINQATDAAMRREREHSDFLRAVDGEGRRIDTHALRHTYCSMLARSNAPVRIVQELARHSDPRLTMNTYSHVRLADATAALEALADEPREDERQALRMTGTEGPIGTDPTEGRAAHAQRARRRDTRDGADGCEAIDAASEAPEDRKGLSDNGKRTTLRDDSESCDEWRWEDSNLRPRVYESLALAS